MDIKSVQIPGGEMRYLEFGRGERRLVILPGLSLRSVLLSAPAIASGYALFREDYTVTLFDRRTVVEDGYRIDDMVGDTAEAMCALGIGAADMIGVSQGGMIAMLLAARKPELVHKLVLCSTAADVNPCLRERLDQWRDLADAGDVRALNRALYQAIFSPAYYEKYRDAFRLLEGEGSAEEMAQFRILVRSFEGFDAKPELGMIRCPVYVIGAADDGVLTADASREIADRCSNAELYIYEGYGHAVYDEAPDYRTRMLEFLRRDEGNAGRNAAF